MNDRWKYWERKVCHGTQLITVFCIINSFGPCGVTRARARAIVRKAKQGGGGVLLE
jgi:hypothetical protein